jgi:hypothetical protein
MTKLPKWNDVKPRTPVEVLVEEEGKPRRVWRRGVKIPNGCVALDGLFRIVGMPLKGEWRVTQ